MAKSSKKQIDEDEKKVISFLQKNCKESIDVIAKKLGFSRQKVWRIIKRLENDKTIWGYHAVVDDEKIGLKKYLVLIKRSTKSMTKETLDKLTKIKTKQENVNINDIYYVNGSYDFFISVTSPDIKQVKKFCEEICTTLIGFVSDIQILDILFIVKENFVDNPNSEKIKEFFFD